MENAIRGWRCSKLLEMEAEGNRRERDEACLEKPPKALESRHVGGGDSRACVLLRVHGSWSRRLKAFSLVS
jgi:hypothetical protein